MNWKTEALGNLMQANYGKALKACNRDELGIYPVYGSSGYVGQHCSKIVDHPTLIIGRKGSVGEVTFAPEGGWPIDTTFYTVIKDKKKLDLRFLYYALKQARLADYTITTSIPGINRDDIYNTKIPLPPLEEQKRIAAILDKADGIRRKRQQAMAMADEFLRSVFLDMFGDPVTNPKGWDIKSMPALLNITTGKLNANAAVENGEYPFFTCAKEDYRIDTYSFNTEALIMSGNNATADYSVKHFKGKFNAYQRTYVFTLKNSENSYYFYKHALQQKLADMKSRSIGTNTKYLTMGIFENINMYVPPSNLQKKFEILAKAVDDHALKQSKVIKESDDLFDSLTKQAFQGAN